MADLNAQTSPLTITARMGAATADPLRLPSLSLNRYGVQFAQLPVLEMSGSDEIYNNSLNTNALYPPNLPAIKLSADGATSINSYNLRLPGLSLSISVGFEVKADLPAPTISGEIIPIHSLTLDANLAELRLDSSTGIRCGEMRINPLQLEIEVSGYLLGSLDRIMPGLSLSASASSPWPANLNTTIPPLSITVSMTGTNSGSVDKSIPALTLSASASPNDYGTADFEIPCPIISATAHQSTINLDVMMSALVLQTIASGMAIDGLSATLTNTSRFTNYVLRHVR